MWERRTAATENIYIADTASFVTKKREEISIDYGGIPGDLHFGLTKAAGAREPMYKRGTEIFNRRQISIVSVEECLVIAEKLNIPAVLPEWLGANISLSGHPHLTRLREGSRLVFPSGAALCVKEKMSRAFSLERSFKNSFRTSLSSLPVLSAKRWAEEASSVSSNGPG